MTVSPGEPITSVRATLITVVELTVPVDPDGMSAIRTSVPPDDAC